MDRMKTFLIYLILFVLFFFFSNLLIFIGLNTNYDRISSIGEVPSQVNINQAEATLVNGRIRGTITNNGQEDLNGKYMKVDLYSPRNVLLGTKYLQMTDLAQNAEENFEVFFKAQDVEHYKISFVDKMENTDKKLKAVFMDKDISKGEIILGTLFVLALVL